MSMHRDIQLVICIQNTDYPAALERRKIYEIVPDASASRLGLVRVIDESGEDYLYPSDYFIPMEFPHMVREAILHAA